ncbi:MAG: hypothetical protein QOC73_845 [Actinomycetota bacterium]|nr:hypothetical protein [Actinomycetota bacterium]
MLKQRDLALLRLAAQRIAGDRFGSPVDVARWMTAMQAQDYAGALTSVALRTQARARADVEAAINAGHIVRSWPMRGTLHFVAAEDLGWMLSLTADRLIAGAALRRERLELDLPTIERARELAVSELSGGRRLRRDALVAIWEKAGLLGLPQRSYHIIWHLAQTGTLCFGPIDSGQQCLVLLDEWVSGPRRLDRDEALGEWALRYFRSHGPATAKDFAWWTKLVAADVKTGLAIAKPHLEKTAVDGVDYYLDPATPAALAAGKTAARGVFLLPGFDEYLLGYQDRSASLSPEYAQRVVPGSNGMFLSTVVSSGEIVGTWKRAGSGSRRSILATPFDAFTPIVLKAIPKLYDALP